MKHVLFSVISILFFLSLVSCAHKPSSEQIRNANYGSYPSNYQKIVSEYMDKALIDPTSPLYSDWIGPSRGYIYDFTGSYFGYRVCVNINAKNRMGGYTGRKLHLFVINNSKVINWQGGYNPGTVGHEDILKMCSGL